MSFCIATKQNKKKLTTRGELFSFKVTKQLGFHAFAGFELHYLLGSNLHGLVGEGVHTSSSSSLCYGEGAKANQG